VRRSRVRGDGSGGGGRARWRQSAPQIGALTSRPLLTQDITGQVWPRRGSCFEG
jgi:hypothetical protein